MSAISTLDEKKVESPCPWKKKKENRSKFRWVVKASHPKGMSLGLEGACVFARDVLPSVLALEPPKCHFSAQPLEGRKANI